MKSSKPKLGVMVIVLFLIVSAVFMVSRRNQTTTLNSSASQSPSSATASALPGGVEYYDGKTGTASAAQSSPLPSAPPIAEYTYPGSKTVASSSAQLKMESTQAAQKITDWYKNKIKQSDFNAKSFSQSSTNGNVFNKLTAAKPGEKIDVTIKKDQSASIVVITVDR